MCCLVLTTVDKPSNLISSRPQVLQRNGSQAWPRVLGRGHSLRHLRGGGQTTQQRVEDSVERRQRSRGKHRPVPHATTEHLYSCSFSSLLLPWADDTSSRPVSTLLHETNARRIQKKGRESGWWHKTAQLCSSFSLMVRFRNQEGSFYFEEQKKANLKEVMKWHDSVLESYYQKHSLCREEAHYY